MFHAWLLQVRNQLVGFIREPAAFVFNLLVPLFIVLVEALAFGESEASGSGIPGLRVVDVLPSMAGVMFVMIIGLFGISVGLSSMIESRTFAGASLRPGGVVLVISSYAVVLLVLIMCGMGIATTVLMLGWGAPGPANLLGVTGVLLLSSIALLTVGSVISGLVPSPRSAQGICSAIFFPLLFFSGAVFPLDSFPDVLQQIGRCLPGYHVAELASATWLPNQPFPVVSLIYTAVLALVAALATRWVFAKREGL